MVLVTVQHRCQALLYPDRLRIALATAYTFLTTYDPPSGHSLQHSKLLDDSALYVMSETQVEPQKHAGSRDFESGRRCGSCNMERPTRRKGYTHFQPSRSARHVLKRFLTRVDAVCPDQPRSCETLNTEVPGVLAACQFSDTSDNRSFMQGL